MGRGSSDGHKSIDASNPYAPPREVEAPEARAAGGDGALAGVDYEAERRSVAVLVLLTVVTGGIFAGVWLLLRRDFLNRLRSHVKLGLVAPWITIVAASLQTIDVAGHFLQGWEPLVLLIGAGARIVATFRGRDILEAELRKLMIEGRAPRLSGAATFFFGVFYLQYRMNLMADGIAANPKRRRRRRKRRKKDAPAFEPTD